MMKLTLSVRLIWMLLSSAEALKCRQEVLKPGDVSWGVPKPCASPDEQCTAVTTVIQGLVSYEQVKERNCTKPSGCAAVERPVSFTHGTLVAATSGYCCNTDGCNSKDVALPDVQTPNGLQCFTCSNPLDSVCDMKVQCVGIQDRCFKTIMTVKGNTFPMLGCASANLCEGHAELERSLFSLPAQLPSAPHCCGTSLCNSAPTFRLSAVPVLLGLFALSAN